jgi:hypothetical protein
VSEPQVSRYTRVIQTANGQTLRITCISKPRPQPDPKKPPLVFTAPSASQLAAAGQSKY